VPTPLLICISAVNGGLFVALFAAIGEMLQPKRFAGIFGASPAVSLANLLVIALAEGDGTARKAADGMIAGAIALAVACAVAIPAVRRWGAVAGSAVLWAVWIAVGAAVGFPLAGGAGGASGAGRRAGGPVQREQKTGEGAGPAGGSGDQRDDRLFAVDFGALREIPLKALAMRFVFGAAISVAAGWIGVLVGPRAGGVMLASPAVLPATLTIIEQREGRGPAVTEVQGAVPGAIALTGFALIAAASLTKLPLAAALLLPLAVWAAVGVGGYLALARLLPAWARDVRFLAFQRRDQGRARRDQGGAGARQA
jgi:hypothetical protein